MRISAQVKAMLGKYTAARNSDEYLLECIIIHYFHGDYIEFMSGRPVAFINSMVRCRRKLQMLGQYEASDKVKKFRHKNSKYRADDNKVSKKDIERIALLKTNKKGDAQPVNKR